MRPEQSAKTRKVVVVGNGMVGRQLAPYVCPNREHVAAEAAE